mmetsp:Transcript_18884/g.39298  ORF Transcript_18884/g.39298 Transcript_18884/m.39298 type:complete len:307 (-) Transcript_18884:29-949(-)
MVPLYVAGCRVRVPELDSPTVVAGHEQVSTRNVGHRTQLAFPLRDAKSLRNVVVVPAPNRVVEAATKYGTLLVPKTIYYLLSVHALPLLLLGHHEDSNYLVVVPRELDAFVAPLQLPLLHAPKGGKHHDESLATTAVAVIFLVIMRRANPYQAADDGIVGLNNITAPPVLPLKVDPSRYLCRYFYDSLRFGNAFRANLLLVIYIMSLQVTKSIAEQQLLIASVPARSAEPCSVVIFNSHKDGSAHAVQNLAHAVEGAAYEEVLLRNQNDITDCKLVNIVPLLANHSVNPLPVILVNAYAPLAIPAK